MKEAPWILTDALSLFPNNESAVQFTSQAKKKIQIHISQSFPVISFLLERDAAPTNTAK